MPKRTREERKALATRKKKQYQQKRAYMAKRSFIPKNLVYTGPLSGLPPKRRVTLKYVQKIQIPCWSRTGADPNIGGRANLTGGYVIGHLQAGHVQFRANSPHQPNIALTSGGTAHQPRQFDLFASQYEHYKVHGSKIKVQLANSQFNIAGSNVPVMCGITRRNTPPAANAAIVTNQYMEDPSTVCKILAPLENITLTNNYKVDKISLGGTDTQIATVTSNPGEDETFVIWASENIWDSSIYSGTAENQTRWVEGFLTILYDVEFFECKMPNLSS